MSQGRQKGPMPEDHYIRIQVNYTYLLEHIKEPVILCYKLFEKRVIGPDMKDKIEKTFNDTDKGRDAAANKLLTYVLENCRDAYGDFIQCLRELGYGDVVNVLENTTNGKNKANLMTEQDKTRHQLEELHKDHDLTKQELENLKKQMETPKTRQDGDFKQMLKKIEKLEAYKKQTEEKEVLTKKRIDELETCIKTLTLNDEDTIQPQLLHGNLSGNTSHTSDDNLSGNTSHTSDDTLSGNTSHTSVEKDTRQQQQQQLFDACLDGTLDDIKNMVNIDVNVRDVLNKTPLFSCCVSSVSPVDKIKYLVSHQADINARDSNNDTILHWACYLGTLSTVEYLVDDLHMDVNTTGWCDTTPLFACCTSSVSPVDKIKYLVSHQADINARDSGNNATILHQACHSSTLSTVQYLVDELHMDVNATGDDNTTPLSACCASSVSPVDKIKYLVSHGADINARNRCDNSTILHQACYNGTLYTVQYLVDCLHLDVHVKNKDGETPLDCCRLSSIESKEKVKYIKGKSSSSFFTFFRYFFRR